MLFRGIGPSTGTTLSGDPYVYDYLLATYLHSSSIPQAGIIVGRLAAWQGTANLALITLNYSAAYATTEQYARLDGNVLTRGNTPDFNFHLVVGFNFEDI